jgi:hypothetical protein
MEIGTLKTLIALLANEEIIKIVTKKETLETPAASVRAKVEAAGALRLCVTGASDPTATFQSMCLIGP